ncbi:MAG: hypothetical protein FJZ87_09635 [Chloroflexi bacterium]|nr:hypothetical protein [Chloroflexota bacterium]
MTLRKHLRLLVIVTAVWLLFFVAGAPDYYQQYSTQSMIIFDLAVLPLLWWVCYLSIKKSRNPMASSFWLAFYFVVPLFFYDLIYIGVYLGYGFDFIWKFWYLSVYYLLPWMILPPTGWWIERQRKQDTI